VTSLDWSPDGRFLLTVWDLGSVRGIRRIDVQTGETSPIALGPRKSDPVWSPDGARVYYRQADQPATGGGGAFIARDVASGNEREIIRRPNLGDLVLSPDGRYIATGSNDAATNTRTILLIPTGGGEPRILKRVNLSRDMDVKMWAPDSRSVVVTTLGPRELWRLPIEGEPRLLSNDPQENLPGRPAVHPDGKRIAVAQTSTATQAQEPGVWVLENLLPRATGPAK
jgi:Tol biopolymer transport system component